MVALSDTPLIHDDARLIATSLGRYTEVGSQSLLLNATLGDYSYCGRLCDIANARIGKFSNIASAVRIGATDHPLDRASLHHFMYRSDMYWADAAPDDAFFDHRATRLAHIGHDTWIGHNAQIKPEVTIGHGAVIAAGAIVTKDVAPYTIVAGVTASPLRKRLPDDLADRMIALAWWDWSHGAIRAALDDFRTLSVPAFLEKYGG